MVGRRFWPNPPSAYGVGPLVGAVEVVLKPDLLEHLNHRVLHGNFIGCGAWIALRVRRPVEGNPPRGLARARLRYCPAARGPWATRLLACRLLRAAAAASPELGLVSVTAPAAAL